MAERAFRAMLREAEYSRASQQRPQPQVIILSGQSGAGKTFSANLLVSQLATLAKRAEAKASRPAAPSLVAQSVVEAGPLLEIFGNACTCNNTNSSRFGKYVKLQFSDQGVLLGAELRVSQSFSR